jgi:mannose-1-phosphate guanylyltransferase/mannose-6-phosphate isomerase
MLQQTLLRVRDAKMSKPLIVGADEHRFFIKRQAEEIGVELEAVLLEPVGRSTASAAALAAEWLTQRGSDELMLLLPSDHSIVDRSAFLAAVGAATELAEQGSIVTFGIKPEGPNTTYGYIEAESSGPSRIMRFVEKPSAETARAFVASGCCYWNAGIFLLRASTLLEEMDRYLADSREAIATAAREALVDGLFVRPEPTAFARAESISIDHGIMQRTQRGMVVPVDLGWSDVGSWEAVWQLGRKDENGNVATGKVLARDTRNSLLRSDSGANLTTIGLDNLAVIVVRDAVFVAPLARASEVKFLVEELKEAKEDCAVLPSRVVRPWGSYETLELGDRFQIKRIIVDPGETLSLQMHFHRSEHWIVVRGTAEVTVGDKVSLLQENQSTYISAGARHRLANPGRVPLELVEVQCGPYLGEDDIVRFEDSYGRF